MTNSWSEQEQAKHIGNTPWEHLTTHWDRRINRRGNKEVNNWRAGGENKPIIR